jgi:hypothetical protein
MKLRMLAWAALPLAGTALAAPPATGPLRVSATNPRYFVDASIIQESSIDDAIRERIHEQFGDRVTFAKALQAEGITYETLRQRERDKLIQGGGRAVFLTGSHTWGNLQDYTYAALPSPPTLDFNSYLAFLTQHHHNFFRLWVWESCMNSNAKQSTISYDPIPYQRPGPGVALDGKPRFDLTRFNQAYFDRMRTRVMAARDKGIYASVMLFNGFSIEGKGNVGGDPWQGHPFHAKNNINGIDGGSASVHTLTNRTVTAQQEAYLRKVIDTVNDLDNVLYEITNEDSGGAANTAWQNHLIRFIKSYEATKPRQHPVGMTRQYPGTDRPVEESLADWISPGAKVPNGEGRKVILNDTDHSYFWIALKADGLDAQRAWVWKNFARGNQCLFMDPYLDPSHDKGRNNPVDGKPDPYWDTLRDAMGDTRRFAERMSLIAMTPRPELSSTEYCLGNPGAEYLIYQPKPHEGFSVELKTGAYRSEWFDPMRRLKVDGDRVQSSGGAHSFKAPFDGDAVLYLRAE